MKVFVVLMFLTMMVSGRPVSSSVLHLFHVSLKSHSRLAQRVFCRYAAIADCLMALIRNVSAKDRGMTISLYLGRAYNNSKIFKGTLFEEQRRQLRNCCSTTLHVAVIYNSLLCCTSIRLVFWGQCFVYLYNTKLGVWEKKQPTLLEIIQETITFE